MWWFLVLKSNGRYEVVNIQCMRYDCEANQLVTGTKVSVVGPHDEDNSAIIIAASHDKQAMLRLLPRGYEPPLAETHAPAHEDDDFSGSDGSSWEPIDSTCSSDASDEEAPHPQKHRNTHFYTKSRVLKPSNRIDPIIPNPLPTPRPYIPPRFDPRDNIIENDYAKRLVRLINDLSQKLKTPTPLTPVHNTPTQNRRKSETITVTNNTQTRKTFFEEYPEKKIVETPVIKKNNLSRESSENEYLTPAIQQDNTTRKSSENEYLDIKVKIVKKEQKDDEWVPIGSGTTLIHKDEYRKINWSSYTKATRSLLLAAFPRQILATHSMTGKKSPAFPNKPAKLCLDQRITEDIILEITDRFDVKKNLVRTIITTKCADECKMMKIQQGKTKYNSNKNQNERKINNTKCRISI